MLKNADYWDVLQNEDTSLLSSIHVMLIEHIIQCRLVQGTPGITASVADPDPGSGAFLTPGSGIWDPE